MHANNKCSGKTSHCEKFKKLRKNTPKANIQSHSQYLNEVIGEQLKSNPKHYIKTSITENMGISCLHIKKRIHILLLTRLNYKY